MKIQILEECGYTSALLGISLSYNQSVIDIKNNGVATKLYDKDGGHNKFLESICMWIDIDAPRYWWQQFDTYRVGTTKQSESTMHTIMRQVLTQANFQSCIPQETLDRLNYLVLNKQFDQLKVELPEGFLQRRIVCTNYKVIRNMTQQRKFHKLAEWREFIEFVTHNAEHQKLLITKGNEHE